jgi:small subunit ribosomal protein S6
MLVLNPDADDEARQEVVARVRRLVEADGGTVEHVNDWGRRRISFPMRKHSDGVYIVITCTASTGALDEVGRVLAISKEVVLRAMPVKLTTPQAEHARANGVPAPVDEKPEGDQRQRGGRGRGRGRR